MNKIDIVIKHIGNDDFYDMNVNLLLNRILAAMDEYAQQQVKNCSIPAVSNLLCGFFEPDNKTSSATKCKCGREKWEHPKVT